tara:strand:+ start:332 stop:700 length:369 start_codon:yes stop_codon:yes gene_type:complete
MDTSGEKAYIRCERLPFMFRGKVLAPGDVMEIPKDALREISHLIASRVVTVHSRDPDAVRSAREDALKAAREERPSSPQEPPVIDYGGFKKAELLAMAKERGISVKSNEIKASIIEKLSQGG